MVVVLPQSKNAAHLLCRKGVVYSVVIEMPAPLAGDHKGFVFDAEVVLGPPCTIVAHDSHTRVPWIVAFDLSVAPSASECD